MFTRLPQADQTTQKTLKAADVRALTGLSQKSLRKLSRAGRLRFVEVTPGGRRLYLREDVDAFLTPTAPRGQA